MENRGLHPFTVLVTGSYNRNIADVAQLVEQSIRNRQVIGSSPIVGSSKPLRILYFPTCMTFQFLSVFRLCRKLCRSSLHMTLLFLSSIACLRGSRSGC